MEKPNYYGIIPATVRYDKRLKPMEKILYSEITALANTQGFCFASNSYFGKLYEVHKNTVGIWINNLVECGYLKVKMIYKENSKEVLERRLYIVDLKEVPLSTPVQEEKILEEEREERASINKNIDTLSTKSLTPYQQKNGYPTNEIIEGNTTSVNIINENITSNNTTTKLDNLNKIEEEETSTKSSSSFVLENSLKENRDNKELEKEINTSRIVCTLFEYGVKEETIKNIIKLNVTVERVKEVLKSAKEKSWGDGAIYKALKENWVVEEKRASISDEEIEDKKKWLKYFAGLDSGTRGEILEIIKPIPLEKLEKNKKRLARTETIFEFKQELRRLGK
ncbi:helix-turn-helix domain-containing protein [Fusobacterium mortiferum]|uniref:helix-turn-helix domain-containing protein n=1 Tax=Fusobacterium mortiferum TaxID=850 RepID=UPI001F372842|nr:helix-turn-helix domain-containing protein [Fusobacterium mortiferum]MCF2627612.1 helix-turn-helix domain-containing protein [Fusobacterium mortiferum]MDY2799925.1 helix-turn-helix domain-containing protein [Fusobacterium mortiferum]